MTRKLRRYEFSERLADILGGSRRDLRVRVTLMVTGGLWAPGPRGPGAPPATPEYAADLVMALMAAPQQAQTVEAIRCFRTLRPTALAPELGAPGVVRGQMLADPHYDRPNLLSVLSENKAFGDALASLLELAIDVETRGRLTRELFGVWVSRGFPVAAVQLGAWSQGRRAVIAQRYELPEGARPPAWLDPDQGGAADPGLYHSVFLPAEKLIEIGRLTTSQGERRPRVARLGPTIAKLAELARNRRHRKPWEQFLSTAKSSLASAEQVDARSSGLTEVNDFGSNPGELRMFTHIPERLPSQAGLVVVLHGCTQTAASYNLGTGWSTLADRFGFALLLPEQRRSNNPLRCFNWFRAEDTMRDSGEAQSIRQMIEAMIVNYGIDRQRVHVTGVSAGGAMTSVMLGAYPDAFAGGAIIAGVPFRAANGLPEAFDCIFQGRSRSAQEWGDLVRTASPHEGPWPRVSVWHGSADGAVKPVNADEIVKQWTNVHGLAPELVEETTVDGHPRRIWRDDAGESRVESYTVMGMGHGVPISPGGEQGCGIPAPFILDVGISSTYHMAKAWGLAEGAARPAPEAERLSDFATASEADSRQPDKTDEAPGAIIVVDRQGQAQPEGPEATEDSSRSESGSSGYTDKSVDLQTLLAKSLEAASRLAAARGIKTDPGGVSELVKGVDIPGILSKSFEAAGLLKGSSGSASGPSAAGGSVMGVDIQAILTKSFEAAGLLKTGHAAPDQHRSTGEPATVAGWESDPGWQGRAAETGSGAAAGLFGYASSGIGCAVGNKVRTVSRELSLGHRPSLSYARKLELSAAVNVLTSASFKVLVDGVCVDEVSAVGMDYSEAEWTERRDIDLSRFAGRKVKLSFEVAANSNVCIEVFAKVWLDRIHVEDALTVEEL